MKIVIADDEPLARERLRSLLAEQAGVDVVAEAGDGRSAERVALCRFAAENLIAETAALRDRVLNGAASLAAARVALG